MDLSKEVLTTGQVAKICRVAPRTVSKWFDTGQLRGYRIPGSKDRRIPLSQLIRFMKAYGIPMTGLESGSPRVLIVDEDSDLIELIARSLNDTGRFDTRMATSAFEAGAVAHDFKPQIIVVDVDLPGICGRALTRYVGAHPEFQDCRLVGISASMTDADRQSLIQEGFTDTLAKPFSIRELVDVLDGVLVVAV